MGKRTRSIRRQASGLDMINFLVGKRQDRERAAQTRLFRGSAPNKDCAERRRELFQKWDELTKSIGLEQKDQPRLIFWLRQRVRAQDPKLRPEHVHFVEEVEEHNALEERIRESDYIRGRIMGG